MQILHIDSSITGSNSVTRALTADIVASLKQANPEAKVDYLDLAVSAPSHLSAQSLGFRTGQAAATEVERQENAVSEALVSQFLAADVIVVGAPFYNFTIPTQLKAWLDRIAQAGRTFKYTATGPVGLAGDKKVIVASARGGAYSTSEAGQAMEHQESYLKVIFGFMGVTDVTIVRAEGVAMGPDAKAAAMEAAKAPDRASTSRRCLIADRAAKAGTARRTGFFAQQNWPRPRFRTFPTEVLEKNADLKA
jgi:FMN-dependent NADH-azoreductase